MLMHASTGQTSEHKLHPTHSSSSTRGMRTAGVPPFIAAAESNFAIGVTATFARDRASSFVLALAGIRPEETPSINVNVEVRAGYCIDISPDPSEIIDRTFPHN